MDIKKYDDRVFAERRGEKGGCSQLPDFNNLDEEIEFFNNYPFSRYTFFAQDIWRLGMSIIKQLQLKLNAVDKE